MRLIRIKPQLNDPEDSLKLRLIVIAAQSLAILALAIITQMVGLWFTGTALLVAGHSWAYRTRHKPNKRARIAVFVVLHLAFCGMIAAIMQGIAYPQAQFAVMATGIISFEVFSRMNLYSALGMGVTNIYVAATLSRDMSFGVFLLVFMGLWLYFLWVADSVDGTRQNKHILTPVASSEMPQQKSRRGIGGWLVKFGVLCVLIVPVVFMLTPHYAGRPLFMPLSLTIPMESSPRRDVINPALPLVQLQGTTTESDYYFGFSDSLDLSYRGGLSDTLLMYVSSQAWSYWRGYAYDAYDGRAWTQSNDDMLTLENSTRARFRIDYPDYAWAETFTQSFYIVQELPNIILAGGRPTEIFFPSDEIGMDSSSGLHTGDSLKPGLIYSVISERVEADPVELRRVSDDMYDRAGWQAERSYVEPMFEITDERYLQLPDTITQRTRDLALELTAGMDNDYDRVVAIRDYLYNTFPYDFYPPPQAIDSDAVDQFLFVDKRGVCEHYVSAMVVMLRSLGIHTRFVVGYGSGDFNPFTGFYEVRASDAHAWVEVFFPEYGWVPFDPTPGWEPDPQSGVIKNWVFSELFGGLDLPNVSLTSAAKFGWRAFKAVFPVMITLLPVVVIAAGLYRLWRIFRNYQHKRPIRYHDDNMRRQIFRAYRRAQRKYNAPRAPGQTVQEHINAHPDLAEMGEIVDIAAYRPQQPDKSLLTRLRKWLNQKTDIDRKA